MTTSFLTIKEAIAEIELLSNSGYVSFKCYKQNNSWYVEAK